MGKGGGECTTRSAMSFDAAAPLSDAELRAANQSSWGLETAPDADDEFDDTPHEWLQRTYQPSELPDAGPYGGSLEAAANTFWAAGGCAHLALAFISLYPQLKIAVDWYSDHGRRAVSHAVAYDPDSGRCFDVYGTQQLSWALPIDTSSIEVETDVDPVKLAEHMDIRDLSGRLWSPENPWANHSVYDAAELIDQMFPPRPVS